MIDSIITLFINGYHYIRRHPQIVMTLVLIIIIPISFVINGQKFLTVAKQNQMDLERERIGMLHDVLVSLIPVAQYDPVILQKEIEHIAQMNPDIRKFVITKEIDGDIHVVASLDTASIGLPVADPNPYRSTNVNSAISLLKLHIMNGVRYWEGYRLVRTPNTDDYYIYTETSLEYIDNLFADRIVKAYYWLFGILAVVLLLVVRHVRLIDYAYLYKETKKANEMKDLFTNMIAHELRAPLTAMRGYASMISEKNNISDDVKLSATRIGESSERLVLIVSDLLDVARFHSGKLSIKKERCNIRSVIEGVLDAMQAVAREKNINLTYEGLKNDVFIETDEKRLYQAFVNLVSNSIKYTKAGSISLSVEERTDRIEIRVKDTGMGISADNQKNLFTPFFRIENIETQGTLGTGLGMWITKQLIELMKGSIAVESIRGVGTHIVVTLPK